MRTLGARDGSTKRVSLRQRLTAGLALSVAAASAVIVGTSVPALASVSAVLVTPVRAAAGATATYTITFTATAGITIGDTITIAGPGGTVFPLAASHYSVNSTAVAVNPTGGGTATVGITSTAAVTAGATATVAITGVTNPTAGSKTLTVATTADAGGVASASYTISAATAVTGVTVPTVSPAKASITTATYIVDFTGTTALVSGTDTITLSAPATTVFPLVPADYTINAGGITTTENLTPTQTAPNNVTLNVPPTSGGGAAFAGVVNAFNVTNPSTASTTETINVSTSQDATAVTSANYTITAATAVAGITVAPVPTSAGSIATYTVAFTATSALTANADTITIVGPGGTLFPLVPADYIVNGIAVAATPTGSAGNVTIQTPIAVTAGATATVQIAGATNPTAAARTLTVATSQDSVATTSTSYTITAATAVTALTVVTVPTTAGAVARYTLTFTATTALSAGSTITFVAPSGTLFPLAAANYTVNSTAVTVTPTGTAGNVTLTTPVGVAAAGTVTVSATGITNPVAASDTLTAATSEDTAAATSGTYVIATAGPSQVTTLTAAPSPTTTGVAATYTVMFTATTALTVNVGTITLTGPTGTVFPLVPGDYTVRDNGGTITTVTATPTGTAGNVTITTPVGVTASTVVIVVASGVTNAATGPHTLTVATSTDTTPLASPFFAITAAGGGGGGGVATTPATPVRLAGADRFGTAIAASLVEFPTTGSASAVVLARSDDYPDALVGTALAAARHAPLLFANGGALTPATVTEIQRVIPAGGTVYVLGGLAAVPASVATTLTSLGFVVTRYAGADRFGTALLVADALGDPSTVLLATGINFPDALAAGPAAAHLGGVVLLTDGTVLTAAVKTYLTAHPGAVYAIGGPAVTADPAAIPLSGADRYGTAAAVATALFASPNNVGVASGTQFPDALSGGAFQGHFGGPIVLTDPGVLPTPTSTYLTGAKTTLVTTSIFGGTAALSATVQASISTALGL